MGFITKLGVVVLGVIFVMFFGDVTFAPFTGGLDFPVSYGLLLLGAVLMVIGLFWPHRPRTIYR